MYQFRIFATNSIGHGNPSKPSISRYSEAAVPKQMAVPVVGKLEITTVTLHWEEPWNNGSVLEGYIIEINGEREIKFNFHGQKSHSFDNLVPGKKYWFRIKAWNFMGEAPYSESTPFVHTTTSVPGVPPGEPQMLEVSPVSATIVWTAAEEDNGSQITHYCVQRRERGVGGYGADAIFPLDEIRDDPNSQKFQATIYALFSKSYYEFQVAAINANGQGTCGKPSQPILTAPAVVPSRPFDVKVSEITPATVVLKWDILGDFWKERESAGNGAEIQGYKVQRQDDDGRWGEQFMAERYETTVKVERGLKPKVTYRFRIAAFNSVGDGHFSEPTESFQCPTKVDFVLSQREKKRKESVVGVKMPPPDGPPPSVKPSS
jgi:hypothetical protein